MNFRSMLFESGAIVEGHFVLNSMRHARLYVNKTAALVPAAHARAFGARIGSQFLGHTIDAIVAPELGAITLMTRVSDYLSTQELGRESYGVIATKIKGTDPPQFEIGRDQARFVKGKRVLVVEDVITSGLSIASTIRAAEAVGGIVVAAAALWNRGSVTAEKLGVSKLVCVVEEEIETFPPDDCPLCRDGIPVNTNLGKGTQFLAEQANKGGP